MPSLKSLRPLSVAEVVEDDPIRLTKKSLVFVGQSSFDGQMVRFLSLASSLPPSLWSVHFVTLSSENSPIMDKIKAEFEKFNATFNRIELPEIDLESVERDNEFLKDEEKYIYDKVRRYSTILR
ncbi:hypothetical protein TL16_g02685 [Triparma laevis f. inornata]|uniref:Uncharacterized protein n=2 Tax=Triparma laevis TaxID=1534972 RepID=A0A9W7EAA7_9STRA|nr:hypothetical protein TL16_g02685 [Triparma laevis f. inornata]GMH74074.1 hypothetical protein TrLO_g9760 [Triparma laevis f. longispina]